ncbi:ATP-dependent Clp protease adaptor ClpS [Apibacter muscae]|uniref:ATP-dependent Clp protease adaptor ClpS n=1 Tax=Apibacter muscae TaxID=2509004 RepID=A0A563D8C0_9FLAO|nr:ATP-dependent Clp protease adaptor ClpS [Apibacter muscae]TWP26253.1 ATP-dependent Clp protease adaptor ClpS [Apibacter muscae]TWP28097.1 ATP-dependent Clp protease adaptor ClpS [Apibacter muscae]
MNYSNSPLWEEKEELDTLLEEEQSHTIVLHNDEVNTFDYVINCLIEICEHTLEQAQQCTYLVHYKGKCEVKSGSIDYLIPINNALLKKGLSSEIV